MQQQMQLLTCGPRRRVCVRQAPAQVQCLNVHEQDSFSCRLAVRGSDQAMAGCQAVFKPKG